MAAGAMSADRLRDQLSEKPVPRNALLEEAGRLEQQVSLLRAVLDAMRAFTATPPLTFTSEVLREIVEEAASLAFGPDGRARPPIEVQVPATIGIEVERTRLIQAVTNLLVNALESYPPGSPLAPIVVRAETHEGHVVLSIEDSGCGMSEEALSDAKTLFATSKPNGTGFGLPLAIKIVESEHGGQLSLESTKGNGTVVRLVIPTDRKRDYA